jgi:hypothetical protein
MPYSESLNNVLHVVIIVLGECVTLSARMNLIDKASEWRGKVVTCAMCVCVCLCVCVCVC